MHYFDSFRWEKDTSEGFKVLQVAALMFVMFGLRWTVTSEPLFIGLGVHTLFWMLAGDHVTLGPTVLYNAMAGSLFTQDIPIEGGAAFGFPALFVNGAMISSPAYQNNKFIANASAFTLGALITRFYYYRKYGSHNPILPAT